MKRILSFRVVQWMATGAIMLQMGGCNFTQFNDILQTVLLGVTAAGGYAILRNI